MIAKGESFGDSLGDSTRRRTNAIAKEDSQLLVIKKQYFAIIANANSKS
jgi:CRP-like cAMP-binding protein